MKKTWEVEVDGVKHTVEYKAGFGIKVIVDGEEHKAKSSNWFINMLDYSISFGDAKCNLTVIGNKIDLAVNGTYLGSGKPYEPLSNVPVISYVFLGISVVGGWFLCGLIGALIGLLMGTLYVKMGLEKKIGAVVALFFGCTAIQVLIFVLVLSAQMAAYIG